MKSGCYTAIITPFSGEQVDFEGLRRLIEFQVAGGTTGVLAVGTTGESPVLSWEEHNRVVETTAVHAKGKCLCIAGAGSNNTKEAVHAARHAEKSGAEAVLLVDPYYNGPSSLEIRREYFEPVARAVPGIEVIPYVIPGRTGAQTLSEDLAILYQNCKNARTVKEATGNIENMRRTRACCGSEYGILSGDDALTFQMMSDPQIQASGVISVVSNVAPAAVSQMIRHLLNREMVAAERMNKALAPLFDLVTVKTTEQTPYGDVVCRARNPLAIKTLMAVLGMPSGGCRQPLGKMTVKGLETVLAAARIVQQVNPEIFAPVSEFFGVNIDERLGEPGYRQGLFYDHY